MSELDADLSGCQLNGRFRRHYANYAFLPTIAGVSSQWRINRYANLVLGQGFSAGDKDSQKQQYTAQDLDLHPLYRRVAPNIYLGVGWSLNAQHAAQMDGNDPLRVENTGQGASVLSSGSSVELTGMTATLF